MSEAAIALPADGRQLCAGLLRNAHCCIVDAGYRGQVRLRYAQGSRDLLDQDGVWIVPPGSRRVDGRHRASAGLTTMSAIFAWNPSSRSRSNRTRAKNGNTCPVSPLSVPGTETSVNLFFCRSWSLATSHVRVLRLCSATPTSRAFYDRKRAEGKRPSGPHRPGPPLHQRAARHPPLSVAVPNRSCFHDLTRH